MNPVWSLLRFRAFTAPAVRCAALCPAGPSSEGSPALGSPSAGGAKRNGEAGEAGVSCAEPKVKTGLQPEAGEPAAAAATAATMGVLVVAAAAAVVVVVTMGDAAGAVGEAAVTVGEAAVVVARAAGTLSKVPVSICTIVRRGAGGAPSRATWFGLGRSGVGIGIRSG